MAEQRDGRAVRTAVLVGVGLLAALVAVFFFVPRHPPNVPPRSRGEPTACRLARGDDTVAKLAMGATPYPAQAGDVLRCTVAPTFREHLEVWAAQGDGAPLQVSAQAVNGRTELAGVELPAGRTTIWLVHSDVPPDVDALRQALRAGGVTPRLRVERFAVEAR